jgi:hypothetical protein
MRDRTSARHGDSGRRPRSCAASQPNALPSCPISGVRPQRERLRIVLLLSAAHAAPRRVATPAAAGLASRRVYAAFHPAVNVAGRAV